MASAAFDIGPPLKRSRRVPVADDRASRVQVGLPVKPWSSQHFLMQLTGP